MTAETAPQPERQARAQRMVGWGIVLAAVPYTLLRDHRFHVAAITGILGAWALASLIKNNEARPVRRAASWYWKAGSGSRKLARVHPQARQELARKGQALEAAKRS
jgi:hypothetical protein